MIKYKNNINVGTGSVGYEADATSASPLDSVNEGRIVKSEGRTVKWNQIIQNGDFSDGSTGWSGINNGTFSVVDGVMYVTCPAPQTSVFVGVRVSTSLIENHKYYIAISTASTSTSKLWIYCYNSGFLFLTGVDVGNSSCIVNNTGNGSLFSIAAQPYPNSCEFTINNIQAIDLTSIFGAGNEPSTVEAFESWLAENMIEQDYYAYDAGSLVPVTVKGVKRDVGGTTVTNPMPVTTLIDENDVVMFPDGLKSAGSAKDEIDWEHGVAVKKIGVVDLGLFTYTKTSTGSSNSRFVSCLFSDIGIPDSKALSSSSTKANAICSNLVVRAGDEVYLENEGVSILKDGNKCSIYLESFKDSTDVTAFKIAVTGQKLYYELATPVTYHFATHADLKKRVVKIGESVEVDGIEGETVIWNQMVYDDAVHVVRNNVYIDRDAGGAFSFVGTASAGGGRNQMIFSGSVKTVNGHKYLSRNSTGIEVFVTDRSNVNTYVQFGNFTRIITANKSIDNGNYGFNLKKDTVYNNTGYLYLIDLTQMFGSGNEPSTVAEFESWLSAHGGIKDYYPYCAGELKDKEEGNVRGVGFNLWDEEWEVGDISSSTGNNSYNQSLIRSKNYIPILSETTYFNKIADYSSNTHLRVRFYNASKTYIGYLPYGGDGVLYNSTFKTPSGARYMRFATQINYGSTYNHDICINLSDASRNGTYVPYKSITRSVDLTTLKGKVNGAGEDVVMFPDGMKQAGSVKDEIFVEGGVVKAVKRVGTVDLGELTYIASSSVENGYVASLTTLKNATNTPSLQSTIPNVLCAKYPAIDYNHFADKTITYRQAGTSQANSGIFIKDSSFAGYTTSQIATALNGVMLNYELASPVTYVVNMQGMEMAEVRKVMVGTQKVWEKS